MTYQFINLTVDGAVAVLALNRPEKRNALTPEMAEEICDALADCGPDGNGARTILLKGQGFAFCSGADLSDVAEHGISSDAAYETLAKHYNPMLLAIAQHALPVVAQVHGAASGIGCSLALACDFCIAAQDAHFTMGFVNIGLAPDGGASWLLPRLVGRARALELMMLGDELTAAKAVTWGLIRESVPDGALAQEARALAERLANRPTLALGAIKRNLVAALDASLADTMEAEAQTQRKIAETEDAREGIEAFLQKRTPTFKGR